MTTIKLGREPFAWMNDVSRRYLAKDYLLNGQSGEDRVGVIADTVGRRFNSQELRDKVYEYASYGWFSFSSPVWSNFGLARGLPISCFGTYVDDSVESILDAHYEVGMMSKHGGGTSLNMTPVRPRGSDITDNGKSAGSVHFALLYDTVIRVISQGSSRRGECAAYWDIEHPDAREVLDIQTDRSEIQKLNYGFVISNAWMESLVAGDQEKRKLWAEIAKRRREKGRPYLIFGDNANNQAPEEYKRLGLRIFQSNLCTEIFLANTKRESFVCCLSSMNMLHYDEWKNTDAVEVMVHVLDAVMSEFIEKASGLKGFKRAVRFAKRQRALGLGQIGWHTYLQSRMIPYDSPVANGLAVETSRRIKEQAFAASAKMAATYGEPKYLRGSGRRHMTLTAIAPTQSSAAIIGQISEGIELMGANFVIKDKQKVKYTYQNPYLLSLLAAKGKDTRDVVDSIFERAGSVQHLDFMSKDEKAVFRTALETHPMAVVRQAAMRQPFVCQGQSLNLTIDPAMPVKEYNQVLVEAWRLGLKSLYYQHNVSSAQTLSQNLTSCAACEG